MRSLSLTRQLMIFMGALILAAAVIMTGAGYWLVHGELDQQARSRLDDARRYGETLLLLEETRLESSVMLAAGRPTLHQFLSANDLPQLQTYLDSFRQSAQLDFLSVSDAQGAVLAGVPPSGDLSVLAFSETIDDLDTVVNGAIRLDDALAARMGADTGVIYRFVALDRAASSALEWHTEAGVPYYRSFVFLHDFGIDVPVMVQIDLPLSGILAAEQSTLIGLLLIAAVIALGTALIVGQFVRTRMRSLWQLTASARRMGVGDLKTPIQIETNTLEMQMFAQVLEKTRVQLLQNIDALSESRQWSETLIQSVVEGFITCDSEWRILFFSAGATRVTGWNADEAVGQSLECSAAAGR